MTRTAGSGTDGPDQRQRIAAAYRAACALELDALKPGNVHRGSAGHGMTVADFLTSARVSAGPLTEPGLALGERVYRAVAATRAAVGCNTNLGIILLCAPLIQAALDPTAPGPLRARLQAVLSAADRGDMEWINRAIRRAAPGGLGTAAQHDVHAPATATPREVMAQTAHRDLIAAQYATGFRDLFERAAPLFARLQARWQDPAWAAAGLYLDLLGRFADTHIARKLGPEAAQAVSRRAAPIAAALARAARPEPYRQAMLALDQDLKAAGINPGSCADLTVACLLIARLAPESSISRPDFTTSGGRPPSSPQRTGHPGTDAGYLKNPREGESAMPVINKTLVGESAVGDHHEVAHIDLIMGPRGSAVETAFCNGLVNNKEGFTSLLAVLAPNLPCRPHTLIFNKVTIKGAKQVKKMFGPAQRGVAMAVADCVADGTIPADEVEDVFICVGVFVHWQAEDDLKIQQYNYEATKQAITRAISGEPKAAEVQAQRTAAVHPFAAFD